MIFLKERFGRNQASLRLKRIKDRVCMSNTSRKSVYVRRRLLCSQREAKRACIFRFGAIWKIACVRNLICLRRRSGLLRGINRGAQEINRRGHGGLRRGEQASARSAKTSVS